MKIDLPEIDSLTEGINDPKLPFGEIKTTQAEVKTEKEKVEKAETKAAPAQPNVPSPAQPTAPIAKPKVDAQPQATVKTEDTANSDKNTDAQESWQRFLKYLKEEDNDTAISDKSDRLICKIDRDIADTLDECNIGDHSRSDLVNAVLRAFFDTNMPQLLPYRRPRKTLFENYTPTQP